MKMNYNHLSSITQLLPHLDLHTQIIMFMFSVHKVIISILIVPITACINFEEPHQIDYLMYTSNFVEELFSDSKMHLNKLFYHTLPWRIGIINNQ